MSFCRFSSDNWKCEVYCYESADGFITHVAENRVLAKLPDADRYWPHDIIKYTEVLNEQMEILDKAERVDIGLPYDGVSFTDSDLQSLLKRLIYLKDVGYHIPDFVITNIRLVIWKEKE